MRGMPNWRALAAGPTPAATLADAWPMRFRPRATRPCVAGTLPDDEITTLPRRSVLVLGAAARLRRMHGIARCDSASAATTRVSETFRRLAG